MKAWPLSVLALALLLPAASDDPLAGYAPVGQPVRCVTDRVNEGAVILDRQRIGIRRAGSSWWVSRIDHCPSLEPLSTLLVERWGGPLCDTDRFRVITPGINIPSAYCRFAPFQRYDKPARR